MLKAKFLFLVSRQKFNTNNDVSSVNGGKIRPYFMFVPYSHRGMYFLWLSLYEYYRVVSVVKRERKQEGDYNFDNTHIQKEMFFQQYFDKRKQLTLIILKKNLSDNEKAENIISGGDSETDTPWVDFQIVFLSLFVL